MDPTLEQPPVVQQQDNTPPVDTPLQVPVPQQGIPDEIVKAMEQMLLDVRNEDRFVREMNVRVGRRLEYYWNNILDIFLDPVSKDWRVPDWDSLIDEGEVAPRLINIYRPHGEAIVAALSVTVPSVFFHPDDADNPDDIEAAKAHRAIVELLELHNEAPMLFIRALVILFNQGTIFGYNYYHQDPKFGTISKPKIEFNDVAIFQTNCPQCGAPLDSGILSQAPAQGMGQMVQCPSCGYQGPADMSTGVETLPQIVGFDKSPKGSIAQKLFSSLQVKCPMYATQQEDCGYLLLEFVQSVPMLRKVFSAQLQAIGKKIEGRIYQKEPNQFDKLPLQYLGQTPDNAANVSCLWLRPYQYYQFDGDPDLIAQLEKTYPDGCYAIFVNDMLMDVYPEAMDDHWTISKNPFGTSIYMRPIGENLATVQDIRAELVEIELQTIEHGIPETFADPKVLDFKKYGEGRSKPGMVTQTKPSAGKRIADGFFTTSSAILSQEVEPFRMSIDQDAQFVVGSFPSVYGGPSIGGSKTAAEYSQSRSMALQRLGTIWKLVCSFWAQFQSRSSIEYATALKELGQDERFTKREGEGFVNVWIRSSQLTGRIGRVEPEATEQLPTTWAQKKDVIMQLFATNIPQVIEVLTDPNNAGLMKQIVGVPEFFIPGEDDRMRQRKEFLQLSQGMQVPVNPQVDNSAIHVEVLKSILEGSLADNLSPQGMQACMMHLQEHQDILAQQQQQQMEMQAQQQQLSKPAPKQPVEGQPNA